MKKTEQKEIERYHLYNQNPHYKMFEIDSRLRYFKPHATKVEKSFVQEITHSLGKGYDQKFINPKFFYDKVGSEIFEEICATPEYYLTRTEISLLERVEKELCDVIYDKSTKLHEKNIRLVELGSGSSVKTRIILDGLKNIQNHTEYMPIDISDILTQSSEQLLADYSHLSITGIIDTYEGGLEFLREYDKGLNLIMFLGSSYGNLSPVDGMMFLRKIRSSMKPDDVFLIGLDMVKDVNVLESAYNDTANITSKFNLNVLSRINAELDADFDLENFEHYAKYNHKEQRIEMYLKSLCEQTIIISNPGIRLHLKQGEVIHTENSYKYTQQQIQKMFSDAGFDLQKIWTDKYEYYTIVLAGVSKTLSV